MQAYAIEELHRHEWRRNGRIFWTRADAECFGQERLRVRIVRGVRLIPVQLNLAAALDLVREAVA